MKVLHTGNKQVEAHYSIPQRYSRRVSKAKKEQIVGVKTSESNVLLKEQILAIQKIKSSLGIENLAAASLNSSSDGERIKAATELAESPSWDNFQRLRIALNGEKNAWTGGDHTCQDFTWAMVRIVEQLDPSQITNIYRFQRDTFVRFSESFLMDLASGARKSVGMFNAPFNQISNQTRINAAVVLLLIVGKVGERLDDEALIIKKLLASPIKDIRRMTAELTTGTYTHKWRKQIGDTGLIAALKKEEDDEIRAKVALAITYANPKAILEEHFVAGSREKFCPLTRVRNDKSQEVREAIFDGVYWVVLAQVKKGYFYLTFGEVPELSPKNRLDCFSCATGIIAETSNQLQRGWGTNPLFPKSYQIISTLLEAGDAPLYSSSHFVEYQKLKEGLTQINLVNFADHLASAHDDVTGGIKIVDHALSTRAKTYEKPLQHFFELRKDISQLYIKYGTLISPRETLDKIREEIDNAIEHYLSNTHIQKIRWGSNAEFNFVVSNLLELLESSQKDSYKIAVLDLFAKLSQDGVHLEGSGNVSLEDALDDSNKPRLKQVLRSVLHLQPVSKELLLNPPVTIPQGKALTVYRTLPNTKSFKDYYGMSDLKTRAIEMAAECFENSKHTHGLLLSGAPGTGKSSFGEILANEIGVPLELLISSKADEGKNGEVVLFENDNPYTLEQYFERIRGIGRCVLLVDEVDEITSPQDPDFTSQTLSFFQRIREARLPIVVIATTNRPILDSTYGIPIHEDGSSEELDSMLQEYVHPSLFGFLKPCYLFHKKSAAEHFAKGYLEDLSKTGATKGGIDLEKASRLARTLTPLKIINALSKIPERPLSSECVVGELRKLRLESGLPKQKESTIRSTIQILLKNGTHCTEGSIDCTELAPAAEDAPAELIFEILSNAPSPLSQGVLLRLFSDAVKD